MGRVWDLIEQHQNSVPYGASVRSIAKAAGVNHTMLAKWTSIKRLPEPDHLRAVARQINVPYRVLLEAALFDAGYLEGAVHGTPIAKTPRGVTQPDPDQSAAGSVEDDPGDPAPPVGAGGHVVRLVRDPGPHPPGSPPPNGP